MSGYQIGDYHETYRTFRLEAPERFNWAYEVFDRWANDPSKLAMLWVGNDGVSRNITYRELSDRSKLVANMLIARGAKPGDRVFIMLPRIVEWWEIMLGCIRSQTVSAPATTMLTARDVSYRINESEAKIAITDSENADKIKSVIDQCPSLDEVIVVGEAVGLSKYEDLLRSVSNDLPNPNNLSSDPMMIFFTSGTTGNPKMVLHTHASYPVGQQITGKFWIDNGPEDLHWTLADTGWAQCAWTCLFAPWNMGAAVFIWDQRGKFDAEGTVQMLERYPITTFFAVPTAYRMIVIDTKRRMNTKALRHCVSGGEPVTPELIEGWKRITGLNIWEGFGQTEGVLCLATFPGMLYKPGSMGVAAPGFVMAVVDQGGNELPDDVEGELATRIRPERPVGLFKEYWRNVEANTKAFRGDWYYTGDRAYRDSDGYFWFVGRADDVVNSSSYRIGPSEVESVLHEHDAVAESAVVASPDDMRGNIVKAFVVLTEGYMASDELASKLQEYVRSATAPYKYPREIEFLEELPKTVSGKIRRNKLREREIERKTRQFE